MSKASKLAIGRRVRAAREYAARQAQSTITQESLAARLAWFPRRIWEIENGLLSVDSVDLSLIAQELDVHPGSLFDSRSWNSWNAISTMSDSSLIFARAYEELDSNARRKLERIFFPIPE